MITNVLRASFAALLLTALSACASNVRTTALVPATSAQTLAAPDSPIRDNISLGRVDGGEETALVGLPKISNAELREALQNAMLLSNILGGVDAPLTMDATLESLDQPQLAVNLEVTSIIFYRVRSIRTGAIVWQERVEATTTTPFTDSIVRSERQRLANEASIKENIETFLEKLNAAAGSEPYRFL